MLTGTETIALVVLGTAGLVIQLLRHPQPDPRLAAEPVSSIIGKAAALFAYLLLLFVIGQVLPSDLGAAGRHRRHGRRDRRADLVDAAPSGTAAGRDRRRADRGAGGGRHHERRVGPRHRRRRRRLRADGCRRRAPLRGRAPLTERRRRVGTARRNRVARGSLLEGTRRCARVRPMEKSGTSTTGKVRSSCRDSPQPRNACCRRGQHRPGTGWWAPDRYSTPSRCWLGRGELPHDHRPSRHAARRAAGGVRVAAERKPRSRHGAGRTGDVSPDCRGCPRRAERLMGRTSSRR